MKISLNFIVGYIIGGITFIPFTIILLLSAYFIYHQVLLPIYTFIDTLFNNNNKKRRSRINNEDRLQMNNMDTASNLDSTSLLTNDDNSTTTSNNTLLYRVGWLKVTQEKEEKNKNSIGDMVISYISGNNKKKVNNVYFAVLKYSTLYLYDSEKQLDCKGVILLNDYKVSTWPRGLQDFELFSKPHTIQLKGSTTTYYVNCNKCIDKEDWFFTFLRASKYSNEQPRKREDKTRFDQSAMNHLITQVHSDEHHFQTQWLNAILGRFFFGVYKTDFIQAALYKKVMSKLDKINSKRPAFLGEINVRSVDPGHALPHFTQPKLLGLSPTGELTAEAYMQYDGGFRIEIETSLLWKYSDRLKPFTLDLVLGITLKEIAGKLLIKIKEPPTNRFWYGFYECPKMEWKVEPLVWEKRVGYSVVVKAIEQKIQEFIVETMVLPHFDDITFFPTNGVGGIFESWPKEEDTVDVNTVYNAAATPPEVMTPTASSPSISSSSSTSTTVTTTTATTTTTTTNKNKKQQQQKEQHRNDEALLTTAKSLPELFSAAAAAAASSSSSSPPPIQQQTSKLSTQLAAAADYDAIEESSCYSTRSNSIKYTNSVSSSPTDNATSINSSNILTTKNHRIDCSPCLIPSTSSTTTTFDEAPPPVVPGQIAITTTQQQQPNNNNNNNNHDSRSLSTSPGDGDDVSVMSTSPTFLTQVLTDDSGSSSDTSVMTSSIQITYSSQQESGGMAATTAIQQQHQQEDGGNVRLRKSSSLALLRPKTGASTAVNVSPAMAHKVVSDNKKDNLDSSISVAVV